MSVSEKVKVSQFCSHLFSITAIIIYFLLVHVRMTQSLSFHARKFWRSDTGASSHGALQHHSARHTCSLKFSNSEYRKWVHVKQWGRSRRSSWVLRVTIECSASSLKGGDASRPIGFLWQQWYMKQVVLGSCHWGYHKIFILWIVTIPKLPLLITSQFPFSDLLGQEQVPLLF